MFFEYVLYLLPVACYPLPVEKTCRVHLRRKRSVHHWQTGQMLQTFSLPLETVLRVVSLQVISLNDSEQGVARLMGATESILSRKAFGLRTQKVF